MLNDKYGDLLDKVIYKPDNMTAAMDVINGFNDGMNKLKQDEIDKHNRMESDRVQKNIEEQVGSLFKRTNVLSGLFLILVIYY